jgi:CDP-diglyceride synthetase
VIAAAILALANLIALVFGYNAGDDTLSPGSDVTGSIIAAALLALVAWGMWRARYWAVLGMQTLLALTIVFSALALVQAVNWWAFVLVSLILVLAGALFWFLIKAMARIQMPERPGSS